MSLPLELFGKTVAIFTAGAGVAIPVAKTLSSASSAERVKLEKEGDLKSSCLIVLQGGAQGQSDSQDKKLIVCQKDKNPKTTEFYFYNQSTDFGISFPKKVQSIKAVSGETNITLVFEKEGEEVISISNGLWGPLNKKDLKSTTRVSFEDKKIYLQKDSDNNYRPLIAWQEKKAE